MASCDIKDLRNRALQRCVSYVRTVEKGGKDAAKDVAVKSLTTLQQIQEVIENDQKYDSETVFGKVLYPTHLARLVLVAGFILLALLLRSNALSGMIVGADGDADAVSTEATK